ncbi:hypothetical protein LTR36_000967 [Oleoguttula mirabilis]|uniref:Uncharacterized protein n=1 Tax=Oleoguttula mirabilis TaxID=1507867 RepID=A0AAV9JPJ2_9PEZI|nr:hypothetical protein LTR36_000967 [Oleoguttula mirabilis]
MANIVYGDVKYHGSTIPQTTAVTWGDNNRQAYAATPPANQQHGDTYNFFINITFNILGPLRDLLANRGRSQDDRNIDYGGTRAIEPSRTRRGSSMADSGITRRIETLPDSSRHSNTHQRTGGRSRYSRSEPATSSRRGGSSKQEPLTPAALWAHEQASRNMKGSGRTSYAEGRSRRALTEMETVRSAKTILSRAKNLIMPARSGSTVKGHRSEGGRSKHSPA